MNVSKSWLSLNSCHHSTYSIQDIYIKEEQGEKSSDVLILDGIDGNILSDSVAEYNLTNQEIMNENNICLSSIENEQVSMTNYTNKHNFVHFNYFIIIF